MIGKYVIIRADKAGVFFGILKEKTGTTVTLTNARKLYYWRGANTVEQLSIDGSTDPENCKFTQYVKSMIIENVIQTIPCEEKAIKIIKSIKEWKSQ